MGMFAGPAQQDFRESSHLFNHCHIAVAGSQADQPRDDALSEMLRGIRRS